MPQEYFNKSSATSLVTTVAFLAVSLIPNSNYEIPDQTSTGYEDYAQMGKQTVANTSLRRIEEEQSGILLAFASKMVESTKDLDIDLAQIISDDFWEMYDRF